MATTTQPPGARYRIQSIERAVSILNAFTAEAPELGVTELADRLALHKSTVHRFLVNLETAGLVERNPRTNRYRLGLRIFELGGLVLQQMNLWDEALPFLEGLVRDSGETGHLAVTGRRRGHLHREGGGPPGASHPVGHGPWLPGPRHQPGQGAPGPPLARGAARGGGRARAPGLHAPHHHRPGAPGFRARAHPGPGLRRRQRGVRRGPAPASAPRSTTTPATWWPRWGSAAR